jgi:hypothetical protein
MVKIMRKQLNKSLAAITLVLFSISCADESLDPLVVDQVSKGTLLALRGQQLDNIYFSGVAGAAFFGNNLKGTETFDFDAEFLSGDPTSLESFDMYVIKRTRDANGDITSERVFLKNVPFSDFKETDDYRNPWVSVSIPVTEILSKIEIGDLSDPANQEELFELYTTVDPDSEERSGGIDIESDLNLANGQIVSSSDLIAPGLYQSDQFYPAQLLEYAVQDVDDYRPIASVTRRGKFVSKTSRPVVPLRSGVSDTLNITFDQAISTPPTLTISPAVGTIGGVVRMKKSDGSDEPSKFYAVYTAADGYTGDVAVTIANAVSSEPGITDGLTQNSRTVQSHHHQRRPGSVRRVQ